MRPSRISIVGLMSVILFIAVSMAALRSASKLWVSVAVNATVTILLIASIKAKFGRDRVTRAWWFGFALFGWTHLLLMDTTIGQELPSYRIADAAGETLFPWYAPYPKDAPYPGAKHMANEEFRGYFSKLLTLVTSLIVALCGATLVAMLSSSSRGRRRKGCAQAAAPGSRMRSTSSLAED